MNRRGQFDKASNIGGFALMICSKHLNSTHLGRLHSIASAAWRQRSGPAYTLFMFQAMIDMSVHEQGLDLALHPL